MREPISSMCLSSNSTSLLVGSAAGNLFVVDVSNSQILRTVSMLGNAKASAVTGKNAVTNLVVLPKPRDLLGHWETAGRAVQDLRLQAQVGPEQMLQAASLFDPSPTSAATYWHPKKSVSPRLTSRALRYCQHAPGTRWCGQLH